MLRNLFIRTFHTNFYNVIANEGSMATLRVLIEKSMFFFSFDLRTKSSESEFPAAKTLACVGMSVRYWMSQWFQCKTSINSLFPIHETANLGEIIDSKLERKHNVYDLKTVFTHGIVCRIFVFNSVLTYILYLHTL